MDDSHLRETRIDGKVAYDGHFLKVSNDRVRLPDGSETGREYIRHPGAVTILCLFDDGRVLLERQYRYPNDRVFIELPAGKIDAGEDPLLAAKRVRKIICSFPRQSDSHHFDALYRAGEIELELTPQGNLAERIRAAGAGIGGFFTPTGYGTLVAEGKETRVIDGKPYVLEAPLHADFAFVKASKGDRAGNLVYHRTARNFNPVMATAARATIAEVEMLVEPGQIDPDHVVTPGIFVQHIFQGDGY